MQSAIFEILRDAVAQKKQVIFRYTNRNREVCPHALGYGPDGREQVLGFQFGGESSKGLPAGGEWRCFEVSQIQDIQTREGSWNTGSNHSRPQTCVSRIIIEVDY